ncbi:MAG: oxaloacetate decarboxylase [Gammaproteobacteria bacterium]|nr:MAG: oxaloacetate decarboxylase [Gammaproteobacteria bacterium]
MRVTLVQQGFDLMLYGMGTVFVFLIVLVLAVRLMSKIIDKFFPAKLIDPAVGSTTTGLPDPLTVKIIQAAIDRHRAR